MSIFVYGENMCSFVEDTGSCCSSTQTEQSKKSPLPINADHIFAQGDVTVIETSNAMSWSALDSSPQGSAFLPHRSPPDSEFLPDRSSPNPGFPPDQAPRDLKCLPAGAPSNSEFIPAGNPPDSESVPAGTLPDSEILPDQSPPNPRLPPDRSSQNSELIPAGSPRDSEFLLNESPQNLESLPRGSPQHPEIVAARSTPDVELPPDESLPNPRLLSNGSSQNSELLPAGLPRDSKFIPEESPQNLESLPEGLPQGSKFFPDKSQSSIDAEKRLLKAENIDSVLEIPEPARFEELTYDRNTCGADQSQSEDITVHGISPATSSDDITIVHVQLGDRKDAELIAKSAPLRSNVNELYPLSAVEKTAVASEDLPDSIEQFDEISLSVRLERLQNSELKTVDRAVSPILEVPKVKKKSPPKKARVDKSPVAGGSGVATSPTILRDKTNQVKILGGTKESLSNVERFRLTSSDSDNTDYDTTRVIKNHERRRSVDQSSSFRIRETDGKEKPLKKRRAIPSPLRDSDISEDEKEPEVSNSGVNTFRQPQEKKKSDTNVRVNIPRTSNSNSGIKTFRKPQEKKKSDTNVRVNIPSTSNNERNTVVSSTRSSDDVQSITNSDSDPLSDDDVASSSIRQIARPAIPPKKLKNSHAVPQKARHQGPITRNYLPWEQNVMIKYLVDNGVIAEAKGNRVWKQMREDGYMEHRPIQSLNNHFRKFILPNIDRFRISPANKIKFRKLLK